jgi:hypothetical protein
MERPRRATVEGGSTELMMKSTPDDRRMSRKSSLEVEDDARSQISGEDDIVEATTDVGMPIGAWMCNIGGCFERGGVP